MSQATRFAGSDPYALTAATLFDGQQFIQDMALVIENGRIRALLPRQQLPADLAVTDLGNKILSPGFLDLQLNGCGGVLFNAAPTLATLETMHQCNLNYATVGFLPTLITSDFATVRAALATVKQWFQLYGNRRGVLGLHLEGPFIAQAKRGIHPLEYIQTPTMSQLAEIVAFAQDFPLKMTLAPEQVSVEQISYLVEHGVLVALGHTNASCAQAQNAFKHGARAATHLFNAMSGVTAREPGVIGAALTNPECYVGLIADLLHVAAENIKLVSHLKPTQSYLVTDAVTPTGTAMTEFDFAGKHLYVRDGRCVDANGTLGGAYLTMDQAVKNCVSRCQLELGQTLMMATATPARLLGIAADYGNLVPGAVAAIIALEPGTLAARLITPTAIS